MRAAIECARLHVLRNRKDLCQILINELAPSEIVGDGLAVESVSKETISSGLIVTCDYYKRKVNFRCRVNLKEFLGETYSGGRMGAFASTLNGKVEYYEDGLWIFHFSDNTSALFNAVIKILNEGKFAQKHTAEATILITKCLRTDYLVNFMTFESENPKAEYIIADARHTAKAQCTIFPELHPAVKQLQQGQLQGTKEVATFITPSTATAINEDSAIMLIAGFYYNGTRESRENFCVSMSFFTNCGNDETERQTEILRAIDFVKALPEIKFMDPYGGTDTIDISNIQGNGLIIRCGSKRDLAENIASRLLEHLGYTPDDVMITTI